MRNLTPLLFAIVGIEIAVVIGLLIMWLPNRLEESQPPSQQESFERIERRMESLEARLSALAQMPTEDGEVPRLEKLLTTVHDDVTRMRVILTPEVLEDEVPDDINVPEYLDAILERVNDVGTQIYEFERDHFRNLRQVQKNLLDRLARLSGGGTSKIPEDPAKVEALLEAGKVTLDKERRRVTFGAHIATPSRTLEVVAAIAGGPLHESLVEVDCRPSALWTALRLLDCETGHGIDASNRDLSGAELHVYVSWEGLEKPVRLEDMLWNARRSRPMTDARWLFTGSQWDTAFRSGEEYYVADEARVLIALTYNFSATAVMACEHEDAGDESTWRLHPEIRPDSREVPLTITIAPEPIAEFE